MFQLLNLLSYIYYPFLIFLTKLNFIHITLNFMEYMYLNKLNHLSQVYFKSSPPVSGDLGESREVLGALRPTPFLKESYCPEPLAGREGGVCRTMHQLDHEPRELHFLLPPCDDVTMHHACRVVLSERPLELQLDHHWHSHRRACKFLVCSKLPAQHIGR